MTRGEPQPIPLADALLAAARTRAVEQIKPAPRIATIPLPTARQVKTAAWWTLGIVLFICIMPVALCGWFVTSSVIATERARDAEMAMAMIESLGATLH